MSISTVWCSQPKCNKLAVIYLMHQPLCKKCAEEFRKAHASITKTEK